MRKIVIINFVTKDNIKDGRHFSIGDGGFERLEKQLNQSRYKGHSDWKIVVMDLDFLKTADLEIEAEKKTKAHFFDYHGAYVTAKNDYKPNSIFNKYFSNVTFKKEGKVFAPKLFVKRPEDGRLWFNNLFYKILDSQVLRNLMGQQAEELHICFHGTTTNALQGVKGAPITFDKRIIGNNESTFFTKYLAGYDEIEQNKKKLSLTETIAFGKKLQTANSDDEKKAIEKEYGQYMGKVKAPYKREKGFQLQLEKDGAYDANGSEKFMRTISILDVVDLIYRISAKVTVLHACSIIDAAWRFDYNMSWQKQTVGTSALQMIGGLYMQRHPGEPLKLFGNRGPSIMSSTLPLWFRGDSPIEHLHPQQKNINNSYKLYEGISITQGGRMFDVRHNAEFKHILNSFNQYKDIPPLIEIPKHKFCRMRHISFRNNYGII